MGRRGGGNNGTTLTAGIYANRHKISWETKDGVRQANYFGSVTQASTLCVGVAPDGERIHVPLKEVLPMLCPDDIVVGGWDISSANLDEAMRRAQVLDLELKRKVAEHMRALRPLPGIFIPDFIATNQTERADNVLGGTKEERVQQVRGQIREFKRAHRLEKVIVMWSGSTERLTEERAG